MNYNLMVHVDCSCKVFSLPNIDNANHEIILSKETFGFHEDCVLNLEIIDGEWKFLPSTEYRLQCADKERPDQPLRNGDAFEILTKSGVRAVIVVIETETLLAVYQKFTLNSSSSITIGKDESNVIVYDFFGLVSRNHARIYKDGSDAYVEDHSSNGLYVNAKRINGSYKLVFGDLIDIFGLQIIYLGEIIGIRAFSNVHIDYSRLARYETIEATMANERKVTKSKKQFFHRSPRNLLKLNQEKITIEKAPKAKDKKEKPTLLTIGPSFTMALPMIMGSSMMIMGGTGRSGTMMFTGIVTAVTSAILGVTWATLNLKYAREESHREEETRYGSYSNYLIKMNEEIKEKYDQNTKLLTEAYPSAEVCCSYDEQSPFLWNRNEKHEDFMFVRLGIGDTPFQCEIEIPKESYETEDDFLAKKPQAIYEQFQTLRNVPVGIDIFKERLIGMIGGDGKQGAVENAKAIIAQIVATICYTDVKIVIAYNEKSEEDKKKWAFAKWLPHVWSADKKTRYFATNREEASDVFFEIANIIRIREEEKQEKSRPTPHFVLFIEDMELLEGELLSKYVFEQDPAFGLTTFLIAERYEELPNVCEQIIENDSNFQGIYNVTQGQQSKVQVQFDYVSTEKLEHFTRRLASIEVKEIDSNGEIPNSLDFFEMYGVSSLEEFNVLERWKKNRTYESMKALIGKKAGGNDCYLDIHEKYHGPHGLIAGTTGSGKSETLQTYILSLALNFSPYDVGFFVIDFKGGGMANLFTGLPHLIGQISNLSGNQVTRAMVSIKSENKRRQRIFNEHGVNNINLYTRLLKNNEASIPVPHLFIIIDEFAELKREEPEFMKELISVAQVGRSLGVHLILATQKPSGTVDDNIWSNTKFRLCLRVADKSDSKDMLHKPDAAYITQAGRCYLQVGNDEIYELFQSGWSGAVYDENEVGQQGNIATMLTVNGKAAIIGSRNKIKKKEKARLTWMTQLVRAIYSALGKIGATLEEVKNNTILFEKMCDEIFAILQELGLDFQDSKFNRLRLEDTIMLWDEQTNDETECAKRIIQNAERLRKKLPELKEKTQLDAVVEYLDVVAKENGYTHNIQLWMPLLPTHLYLKDLAGYSEHAYDENGWKAMNGKWKLETVIGFCDDPENQAQMPINISFSENGHHTICGGVVSGKSTFLQSVVYGLITRYSPQELNLYLIDFSSQMLGAFEDVAHVGGVMYESDLDMIDKCFGMLMKMLEERKKLFRGGNYSQYVQVNGVTVPAVVVAIDNMANFREKTGDKYEDYIMTLSRDAASYGIFLIITAAGFGSSEIPNKIRDNFGGGFGIQLSDKYKYSEALNISNIDTMPENDIKGRGLALYNGVPLEFQVALALEAEDDYARSEKIREVCQQLNAMWQGPWARKVPVIPENPVLTEFEQLPEYREMIREGSRIPVGYDQETAEISYIDLSKTYCYLVTGKKKSGKTNYMKIVMEAASKMDCRMCVFDEPNGRLKKFATEKGLDYYTEDQEIFDFWKELTPEFVRRNKMKNGYLEELEEDELYDKMRQEQPIFIFIGNLNAFCNSIYAPKQGIAPMNSFMENITEKGMYHNIFIFANLDVDDAVSVATRKMFLNMKSYKNGMHFGGNLSGQRVFKFSNISYKEEGKSQKPGIGYMPSHEDEEMAVKVVVPLAK